MCFRLFSVSGFLIFYFVKLRSFTQKSIPCNKVHSMHITLISVSSTLVVFAIFLYIISFIWYFQCFLKVKQMMCIACTWVCACYSEVSTLFRLPCIWLWLNYIYIYIYIYIWVEIFPETGKISIRIRILLALLITMVFPCGSAGKESACNMGDLGSIHSIYIYTGYHSTVMHRDLSHSFLQLKSTPSCECPVSTHGYLCYYRWCHSEYFYTDVHSP